MSKESSTVWFTVKHSGFIHQFTGYNPQIFGENSAYSPAPDEAGTAPRLRNLCYPVQIRFIAEGAANFIFGFLPAHEIGFLPKDLEGKLLRVRKLAPGIADTSECWDVYATYFLPLLGHEHVLEYTKVLLEKGMHNLCKIELQRANENGKRSDYRKKDQINFDDNVGLLMPNMKMPLNRGLSGDFKLKWLTQSRDAPANAIRCRTCALSASRGKIGYFCPLQLTSDSEEERTEALSSIIDGFAENWTDTPWDPARRLIDRYAPENNVQSRLTAFFSNEGRRLILKLKELQSECDRTGVLGEDTDARLSLAMTLRDCTLFLKVPKDGHEPIEARLGDLDIKSKNKIPEWRKKEKELREGDWYTKVTPFHENCLISKRHTEHRVNEN